MPDCAAEFAAFLQDEVVADVGHAQWVFTVPKLLRPYFMHHRELLGPLCAAAWQTVCELMAVAAGEEQGLRPGMVAMSQTFGDQLEALPPHDERLDAPGSPVARWMALLESAGPSRTDGLTPEPEPVQPAPASSSAASRRTPGLTCVVSSDEVVADVQRRLRPEALSPARSPGSGSPFASREEPRPLAGANQTSNPSPGTGV